MIELNVDTSLPIQEVEYAIARPTLKTPHQIAVIVRYSPSNEPAPNIQFRLTNTETNDTLTELTNIDGKVLFDLLNLEHGYLNGDHITIEVVIE